MECATCGSKQGVYSDDGQWTCYKCGNEFQVPERSSPGAGDAAAPGARRPGTLTASGCGVTVSRERGSVAAHRVEGERSRFHGVTAAG